MGRWWTGYTSIAGDRACIVHSHGVLWRLASPCCRQSSHGYGLFEAKIPSEKMRWIHSLRGAECELEDSRDRVPLPQFGGDDRERSVDDAAAEAFDSLQGALQDPRRWGLSSEAISTLGERLYEFWQRFRGCFKTCTHDTSGRAYDYLRGQLTMDGERNFANMARNMTGDDGQALQHFMSNSPWSGPV